MTINERIHEIVSGMTSFPEDTIQKSALQSELLKLQSEMVAVTYNDIHAENAKLRIQDVERHIEKLNEERHCLTEDELKAFMESCKTVCMTLIAEINGNSGEFKAARSLEVIRSKKHILRNIEFASEDRRTELDFIVLTKKGIFIIEVKNPQRDIYIDERGNYCSVGKTMVFDKNIGECMNNKEFLLRQALSAAGFEDSHITSFVVFTNFNIQVENRFEHITKAYLSDLPHLIEKHESGIVYTEDELAAMVEGINAAACKESYPLPFDVAKFKTDFATIIAKLEGYTFEKEAEAEIPEEKAHAFKKSEAKGSSSARSKDKRAGGKVAVGMSISFAALLAGGIYEVIKGR